MIKAHIIKRDGGQAVYYPGSDRTLSLSDCLKRVFTNENDPLRRNMDVAMEFPRPHCQRGRCRREHREVTD